MENIIICDLDGTLCNINHRRYLVEGKKKNFDLFNAKCKEDSVHLDILNLLLIFIASGYRICFVSGREESFREETLIWLKTYLPNVDFDLFMRPVKDYRPDEEVKRELYTNYILPRYNTLYVLDDRDKVVSMWRELGLRCLQVAAGNF